MRDWRKLHKAILTSDRMPECSFEALWLWTLLTVAQDDAGRYPWSRSKVANLCAAYGWTYEQATNLADELANKGIVDWQGGFLHLVNGEAYNGQPNYARQPYFYQEPHNGLESQVTYSPVTADLPQTYTRDESSTSYSPLSLLSLSEGESEGEPFGPREIVTIWNETVGGTLPRVERLTDQRRRSVTARLNAERDRDETWWRSYFQRIAVTAFCAGNNGTGWRATFDWAVRSEDVVAKVLEGNYERANGHRRPAVAEPDDALARRLAVVERDE